MYNALLMVQFFSIPVLLIEGGYVLAKGKTSLHTILFFNCVATLVNNSGYLFEMLARTEVEYFAALRMSYLGRVWIPFSLLIFTLNVCGKELPKWGTAILAAFHGITYLLVMTSKHNNLYYTDSEYVEGDLFPHIVYGHG